MDDADLELTVNECLNGSLSYNGQRCTAIKVIYVHENIKEKFLKKFCESVDSLKLGLPWENTLLTPLPEPNKPKYISELIDDALKPPGGVRAGGAPGRVDGPTEALLC